MGSSPTIREQISQILIKWGMPTRQAAIIELESLIAQSVIEELEYIKTLDAEPDTINGRTLHCVFVSTIEFRILELKTLANKGGES